MVLHLTKWFIGAKFLISLSIRPNCLIDRMLSRNAPGEAYLDETDVLALLTEALTADVQAVFADQAGCVGANATIGAKEMSAVNPT